MLAKPTAVSDQYNPRTGNHARIASSLTSRVVHVVVHDFGKSFDDVYIDEQRNMRLADLLL
ncbi:uncharacterized protein EAF02_004811 [Botrytis sinoallii]|uniref:uncharacterized protein n=1 Tax=Botrytis sinoallii TaxID=1463999 RepID=UPI0019006017|nr:uncharacterized protein EAF02_004811 [Botrytis sinoallii]KAF7884475.1 hypothetical protein EAF02_004811 [Botrytis sinoallii]